MLSFVVSHCHRTHVELRLWWLGNPKTSAMFTDCLIIKLDCFKYKCFADKQECNRNTSQCGHSEMPAGERSLKMTKTKGNIKLQRFVRACSCWFPHIILQGADPETGQNRAATAAAYGNRYCKNLCRDFLEFREDSCLKLCLKFPLLMPCQPPLSTVFLKQISSVVSSAG